MRYPRTDRAYNKADSDSPDRIDALLAECEKLEADLGVMRKICVHVYNVGYHAGHNDTVEAGYVDVHTSDMGSYHTEEVAELVADLFLHNQKTNETDV